MAFSRQSQLRLAVLSPKGGCGRTTMAINLAYLLAAAGRRVALVDLAQFGSLSLLLQVPAGSGIGLGPVSTCLASVHHDELADVLQSSLATCQLGSHRVTLLAAAPPQRQDDLVVEGVLQTMDALSTLGYDLVLDTSHELSDRLAGALHGSTHRLWVLSPDPAAGWHLLQAVEALQQLAVPAMPTGLLVNRYHRRCGLRLPDLEAAVGLPIWGVIPDLPKQLPLAAHLGVPLPAHRAGPWRRELRRVLTHAGVATNSSGFRWPWRRREQVAHVQI